MTKLPLENVAKILTDNDYYNDVTSLEEVYNNEVAYFLVTYEEER